MCQEQEYNQIIVFVSVSCSLECLVNAVRSEGLPAEVLDGRCELKQFVHRNLKMLCHGGMFVVVGGDDDAQTK
jgi:hypothetical protein